MRLKFKGFIRKAKDLPEFPLPANAVQFREPETVGSFFGESLFPYSLPLLAMIGLIWWAKTIIWGETFLWEPYDLWGCLIFLLFILPHELLHAVCFSKESEVLLYICPFGAMVLCAQPLPKKRYIFMSLLPLTVLGLVPLLIWMALPPTVCSSSALFTLYTAAALHTLGGCGDVMLVCNALQQVPNNAMIQMSGLHTYWYVEDVGQGENNK